MEIQAANDRNKELADQEERLKKELTDAKDAMRTCKMKLEELKVYRFLIILTIE
jgi:archaellum component FlaC